MTVEMIYRLSQIFLDISIITATIIWFYLFRCTLKNQVELRQRIEYLEHKVKVIEEPCYRGY